MEAAPPGQRLGRYRLTARIARGGMGEVWAAQLVAAAGFRKPLVVKRIRPDHAGDWDLLRRFLGEARLAASLSHPNLATVYELGEADGEFFIAMEYLRGATVAELRAGGPIAAAAVAAIVADAAAGLDHLHELRDDDDRPAGFIHRDLSATNLMVTAPGVVKILDFGIAKPERAEASSASGARGTIGYMAPEQLAGARLDRRVDVWALGVIGWELCTGARLFAGPPAECIDAIRAGQVPRLEDRGVPRALAAVLHACLAIDAAARPPTAAEVRRALLAAGPVAGTDELAALVRGRSGDAMAGRDRLFSVEDEATQPGRRGAAEDATPLADAARAADTEQAATEREPRDDAATRREPRDDAATRREPGRWRGGLIAIGTLATAGVAAFALWPRADAPAIDRPDAAVAITVLTDDATAAAAVGAPPLDAPLAFAGDAAALDHSAHLAVSCAEPVTIRVVGAGGDLTLGRTPLDDARLAPGLYVLYATADDARSCVKTVIVDAGVVTRETVRLPATLAASPGDC